MIDYDKLKLAMDLAEKYSGQENKCMYIRTVFPFNSLVSNTYTMNFGGINVQEIGFNDIDELIARLQELTQRKSKYALGQKVLFRFHDNIWQVIIEGHKYHGRTLWYQTNIGDVISSRLYPSREALINAQVEYWSSLANSDESLANSECDHENN